jgi:hypothetical protein
MKTTWSYNVKFAPIKAALQRGGRPRWTSVAANKTELRNLFT